MGDRGQDRHLILVEKHLQQACARGHLPPSAQSQAVHRLPAEDDRGECGGCESAQSADQEVSDHPGAALHPARERDGQGGQSDLTQDWMDCKEAMLKILL